MMIALIHGPPPHLYKVSGFALSLDITKTPATSCEIQITITIIY